MNRKACSLIILVFCLCALCGCNTTVTHGHIDPIRTETREFSLVEAIEMVSLGDKIFADISKQDTVTREEFEQFISDINSVYPCIDTSQWKYMFFYNGEFENIDLDILNINKDMFYPTIYHVGIEIASATITKSYYEDQYEYLNNTKLIIIEKYTGDDPKLANWYREYVYKENDIGEWEQISFGGQINFLEDGIDNRYLPFKNS